MFRDVLGLDEKAAREVKSWAVRALVRDALEESRPGSGAPNGQQTDASAKGGRPRPGLDKRR